MDSENWLANYALTADPETLDPKTAERLRKLAYWLDDRFRIPGTNWRVGLDGLIGLIPGVGDTVTSALAAYIILEAKRLGVPTGTLLRMVGNVLGDYVVGTIPVVGDLIDLRWKANRKNIELLNAHLERHRLSSGSKRSP